MSPLSRRLLAVPALLLGSLALTGTVFAHSASTLIGSSGTVITQATLDDPAVSEDLAEAGTAYLTAELDLTVEQQDKVHAALQAAVADPTVIAAAGRTVQDLIDSSDAVTQVDVEPLRAALEQQLQRTDPALAEQVTNALPDVAFDTTTGALTASRSDGQSTAASVPMDLPGKPSDLRKLTDRAQGVALNAAGLTFLLLVVGVALYPRRSTAVLLISLLTAAATLSVTALITTVMRHLEADNAVLRTLAAQAAGDLTHLPRLVGVAAAAIAAGIVGQRILRSRQGAQPHPPIGLISS